jgi:hypothetical protein
MFWVNYTSYSISFHVRLAISVTDGNHSHSEECKDPEGIFKIQAPTSTREKKKKCKQKKQVVETLITLPGQSQWGWEFWFPQDDLISKEGACMKR